MWFKIKSYLTFLLKSTNQHGVHSPFVFDLVTNCFYKKTAASKITTFKKFKKNLYNDLTVIHITDFGKGSKVFKTNERKVADIAKIAGISNKKALLLIRIIEFFDFSSMLEIGTSVGLATSALSIANPSAQVTSIEGCKNTAKIADNLFNQYNLKNIQLIVGNFNVTLPKVLKNQQFDFIYFDGNHQKEATLNYFDTCLNTVHNNSVFIFDDIYWSTEMLEAWEFIKKHPKVTVTIDTYFWGIVFFRKEQNKQNFTIRC
ncbi:Methyltransferase domain-containing protein [Lutibacter agarilyticus]|uniref:Methyltransferase domain-containing protein n=1 Tax=Lutibacter agarilyticus TaxID=1109740 RepID=A0A238WUL7_9FLAO|nr:class I SAM-dependent methyltransferase [Lutibacter agarilyticus]SNR50088.1 Methyltransferase domain-containing protein [Lutibacter agarilyticus]